MVNFVASDVRNTKRDLKKSLKIKETLIQSNLLQKCYIVIKQSTASLNRLTKINNHGSKTQGEIQTACWCVQEDVGL